MFNSGKIKQCLGLKIWQGKLARQGKLGGQGKVARQSRKPQLTATI